ncbi:30S ribosomal protein S8 [Candidatus Parcubacteria bacterium]|nr:30S ribosomal protein S8 [Candidatus Parcubacteria bacterium]
MVDPISDMLNRIKNAQKVAHPTVTVPFSKVKYEIAKILENQGLIKKIDKKKKRFKKRTKAVIEITLNYKNKIPVISEIKRVSKPGQRIYVGYKEIRLVRGGEGLIIISTPKGLMIGGEARKKKLGGEIICEIW